MVVETQDRVAAATLDERKARIALARWIGDAAQHPLFQPPTIDELPLHGHADLAALEAALREHPDIVLLDKQLELARTDAALARAERRSDWSMELSYGVRGSQYDDMISLGVSIPLQLKRGSRQDREVAARLAMASAAKAQRDDLYREHVAEVRAMLDEWNVMRERLTRFRNEMTPLAKDRVLAAEAAYRGGKATVEELLAARRNDLNVQLQVLQMESELARLWAELSFLGETNRGAQTGPHPGPLPRRERESEQGPLDTLSLRGRGQGEGMSFGVTP
jgi:outer membrane protein TolC